MSRSTFFCHGILTKSMERYVDGYEIYFKCSYVILNPFVVHLNFIFQDGDQEIPGKGQIEATLRCSIYYGAIFRSRQFFV